MNDLSSSPDARAATAERLIAEAGFAGATRAPLAGDASTRRYERLSLNGRTAILMDAPPKAEGAPCPPTADPQTRESLGYNAQARLAASRVDAFVAIAARLRAVGLSAPEVAAYDVGEGLAVVEDLGDGLMWDLIEREGAPAEPIYAAAVDALAELHAHPAPGVLEDAGGARWPLLSYDRTALLAEAGLLLDWFAERRLGVSLGPDARAAWEAAWDEAFTAVSPGRVSLVLRDLHAQNVIWLPNRTGIARVGLLDFQDALAGHGAYDLVSLLEDARRDVPEDLVAAMLARYADAAGLVDREAFQAAYDVLGAQRNAKIVGIFCRLALRDHKARYLELLPRVVAHLRRDLQSPATASVAAWFAEHLPMARWDEASARGAAA